MSKEELFEYAGKNGFFDVNADGAAPPSKPTPPATPPPGKLLEQTLGVAEALKVRQRQLLRKERDGKVMKKAMKAKAEPRS